MTDDTPDSSTQTADDPAQSTVEWHRLSPVAAIYYLVKIVKGLLNNALPSVAPMIIVILNSDDKKFMLTLIVIGVVSLLVVSSLLEYWFFRYRLDNSEILIDQGVFKRKHRVVNFDRVQNININQPIYFRPFKMVTLVIETAGSKGGEGDLAGIPELTAKQIRDQILSRQSELKTTPADDQQSDEAIKEEPQERLIAKATTLDIIRYGISNNGMFLLLAFMAPFFRPIQQAIEDWVDMNALKALADAMGGRAIGGFAIVLGIVLIVLSILMLISVLGSILKFHGYRLTLTDNTLKRKSGLLNTYEESLNLPKIQAIARRCNFIGRWLGRENLICRQTTTSGNKQTKRSNIFIVPARTAAQCDELTKILYPDYPRQIETHPINRRYIFKTLLLKVMLPVALAAIIMALVHVPILQIFWLLPIPFALYPVIIKRWQKYSYGITDEYGVINSGFIGHKQVLFPLFKVQRAVISQSPVQKRRDLATLTIYLASGRLRIPYMPIEHARHWFDLIYYKTETDQRPWF